MSAAALVGGPAGDDLRQVLVVGGGDDVVEDESAITQHRDPVGHREHLVEAV